MSVRAWLGLGRHSVRWTGDLAKVALVKMQGRVWMTTKQDRLFAFALLVGVAMIVALIRSAVTAIHARTKQYAKKT
jgi:hypothetical protein